MLGNPTIITKQAETNVIQVDGQTLVIGGLNKETITDDRTGTPGLMDVPGLNWLFKTGRQEQRQGGLADLHHADDPQAAGIALGRMMAPDAPTASPDIAADLPARAGPRFASPLSGPAGNVG